MAVSKAATLLFGHTENGNVSRMLRGLKRGLEQVGVQTTEVDVPPDDYVDNLIAAVDKGGADFFLAMTGIGLILDQQENIFNAFAKPFISVYLDPLVIYADQIRTPILRRIITTTSDCDIDYWADAAPDVVIRHLPHAAESLEPAGWRDRDIEVLYPATGCDDPEDLRRTEWSRHGARVEAALNAILEEHLRDPLQPLTRSIGTVMGGQIDMASPFAVHPYFVTVDRYLRGRIRWRVLSGLVGLPVTVAGPGWDAFQRRFPDSAFRFIGPCAADDVQAMIRRSKAVVNTCTGYHGSHERVFDAQAAGAVAVSTETNWFRQSAPDGSIFYLGGEGSDAAETLRVLLSRPGEMADIASRGHVWQAEHHTWRHRAEGVLRLLEPGP